jgi:uncharacterized membrane protein YgaE (UPF0421/DUF939 family)
MHKKILRNISICSRGSSGLISNVLLGSRRRYKKIKRIKNKTANQKKKSGNKKKNEVKNSNPKTVLALKNPLQNSNNLQKNSLFNKKKGSPTKKSVT